MSYNYYYNEQDFPNGINISQLSNEFDQTFDADLLSLIKRSGQVIITFDSQLTATQQTQMDQLVANHIPGPAVDPVMYVGSSKYYNKLDSVLSNIQNRGGRFSIILDPEIHVIDNPVVIPPNVNITSFSGPTNTSVVAKNPDQPMFIMSFLSEINSITISGANQPGGVAIKYDASVPSFATCRECIFYDLYMVAETFNSPGMLLFEGIVLASTASPITTQIQNGFYCHSGGDLRIFTCGASGLPGLSIHELVRCEGSNPVTGEPSFVVTGELNANWTDCVLVNSNSGRCEIKNSTITNCQTGFLISGTGTTTNISGTSIYNTSTHLNIDTSDLNDLTLTSMYFDKNKIINPNKTKYHLFGFSNEPTNRSQILVGDLEVGKVEFPTQSYFGSGGSYHGHCAVLQYNQTTWNDITNQIKSGQPVNLFQGTGAGHELYIGDMYKFNAVKFITDQVTASNYTIEHWNGNSWVKTKYMTVSNNKNTCVSLFTNTKTHLHLGTASWQTTTVNGFNCYWIRIVITDTIGVMPKVSKLRLVNNSTKVNKLGGLEYFGQAQSTRQKDFTMYPNSQNPTQQGTVTFASQTGYTSELMFATGIKCSACGVSMVSDSANTGLPIIIRWYWNKNTTGDINWLVEQFWESSQTSQSLVVAASAGRAEVEFYAQDIFISDCPQVLVKITRLGNTTEDTCSDSIFMLNSQLIYTVWKN